MFVFFSFLLVIILLSSFFSKKNLDILFVPIAFVYMAILMGGNTFNPDSEIYSNMYFNNNFTKDIGFGFLINIFKSIGFNYLEFKLIISIIGLLIISISLFGLVKNKMFFYVLYFIYPFMFDVVQVRNFLCMAFLIAGFRCLISRNNKVRLAFIFFVLIGASMQKIGLVYLPIFFIKDIYKKKWINKSVIVIVVLSFIIGFFSDYLQGFAINALSIFEDNFAGLNNYLDVNTRLGWIVFWLQQIFAFYIISLGRNLLITMEYNVSEKFINFVNIMYSTNYYMFLFLPFFVLDESFTRIIRNLIPLNLMVTVVLISFIMRRFINGEKVKIIELFYCSITILYQLILFFLMKRTYNDSIILPLFQKNWIW